MAGKKKLDYDATVFQEQLQQLLDETGESYSAAAHGSGLHQTTISNYMRDTSPSRPMRDACIALADHFGINPNKMLEAAGYEPLHFFDRRLVDPNAIPPYIEQLVGEIMKVENESMRREMVETLRQTLHLQMRISKVAVKHYRES
jgi:hypothetical protein